MIPVSRRLLSSGRGLPTPRFDFEFISKHVEQVQQNVLERKCGGDPVLVDKLYKQYSGSNRKLDRLRQQRNEFARNMKALTSKEGGGTGDLASLREEGKRIKTEAKEEELVTKAIFDELIQEASKLPNQSHPKSPIGGEENATEVLQFGKIPKFDFEAQDHVDIAEKFDLVDSAGGAKIAGSKFTVLRNEAVMMELGLVMWAMKKLAAKGFAPVMPPDVASDSIIERCGFQPRENEADGSASQIYNIEDTGLSLIGTSEISLAGLQSGNNLQEHVLPLRYAGFSHCFRREAGSRGAVNKGLYRLHQFSKVEMFSYCEPSSSEDILQEMVDVQVEILSELGLHGRVLDMPTEELGASANRKFDVEVYMPGRGAYGEVCSASNCTDYQTRRLGITCEVSGGKQFAHTVNATALAVPRVILAILETHQTKDGTVSLPEPLHAYMGKTFLS